MKNNAVVIKEKDLGFDNLEKFFEDAVSDSEVLKVGFVSLPADGSKSGATKHKKSKYKTIAEIAVINNYGTDRIPARPFMEQSLPKIKKVLDALTNKFIKTIGTKKEIDYNSLLHVLGQKTRDTIKNRIIRGNYVPNAPSTIKHKLKRKNSKKPVRPLIDTSQLINSVSYEIER